MEKQLLSIWNRLILIAAGMLVAFLSFGQTATQIELTGTTTNLEATYNVATVVDPNLVITSNGTINGFRVQISQSYTTGDVLGYTGTLPSGVTQSFNTTTGVLSFSGSATAQQWQDLLRTVRFTSTSSVCYPTARVITFTAGTVYYNPLTGHYYEYVTLSPAAGWIASKSAASGRSYFGRIGYLATFSSSAENNFVWKIMSNDGWFGASDDFDQINQALGSTTYANQTASENKWTWATGPEAGTQFSNGATAVTGQYANWNGGEPNNSGGEHYGQFYSGSQGRWNDLRSTHTLGGYLCEYGGMPNDNTELTPFVSRNVTVLGSSTGSITGGGVNVCSGTNSTTLTISNFTGTVVRWESSLDNFFTTGTNITNTNQSYTVTNITQTTYYRAMVNSTSPNTCTNVYTSSVPVYVSPTIPGNITAINNTICAGGDVELTLSGNQGNVNKWQISTNNGTTWTDIANTTTFHSQTLAVAGTYLFRAVVQTPGCGSPLNTANKSITVNAGTPPEGGVVSTSNFCGGTNSGILYLTGQTGTIDKWQQSIDGGIVWTDLTSSAGVTSYAFSSVSSDRMYRAKVTNGGCGSAYSQVGGVVINTASVAGTVTGAQNICGGFPISAISLSGNSGTIQWQTSTNNSTFTNIAGATNNPLTQSVFAPFTTSTYVRALVTNGACSSINSNSVLVSVQEPDTLYEDLDGDGYGNPLIDTASCVAVMGYVNNPSDCDDGTVFYQDLDDDGFGSSLFAGCDGLLTSNDCDDSNPAINVLGVEICNLLDDDCDGSIDEGVLITYYLDSDNDGYGDVLTTTLGCTPPSGYVSNDDDCVDTNGDINPGEPEICNGMDEDCDLEIDEGVLITYYQDTDGDSFGNASDSIQACSAPNGYVNNDVDFDDTAAGSYPGAPELCNSIDDDGDGSIDEGVQITYYLDEDADGYGDASSFILACTLPSGYSTNENDCNDEDALLNSISAETCNNFDDDCDGEVDEYVTTTFYQDTDGDGFGDLNVSTEACSSPAGFVLDNSDCDDASVTYQDGDNDGYGSSLVVSCGVENNTDCNDADATLNSINTEVCNNFDDDCDGTADDGLTFVNYYADADGDGYGAGAASNLCSNPGVGYVTNNTDCNDADAALNSITTEVCNNFDDDCDGTADDGLTFVNYYSDADGDGYGAGAASNLCSNPGAGYVTNNTDCNDADATLNSISTEVCNNFDDDCDGTADDGLTFVNYYVDTDGDGYGAGAASNLCSNPGVGYVTNNTDCNDADAALNAITSEVCNNFDDDCDGTADDGLTFVNYYVDADGDGYGAGAASNLCSNPGAGFVTNNTDCNDADAALNSITTEVCNNFDDDCNGEVDNDLIFVDYFVDADGDGYGAGVASNLCSNPGAGYVTNNTDCNDADATLNSITTEVCNNFDDDCNGVVDNDLIFVDYFVDADGDGYGAGAASNLCSNPGAGFVTNNTDCNDADATLNAITTEVCNNFDDDCNGEVDNDLIFVDYFVDADGDGYGAGAASNLCSNPGAGYVTNNTDCNDADAALNSITTEVCNNFDDDCNGVVDNDLIFVDYFADADGDGYGAGAASNLCSDPGLEYSIDNTDCNDTEGNIFPTATEVCNYIDDNCNDVTDEGVTTTYYEDLDGDGFGNINVSIEECGLIGGYAENGLDCSDNDAAINPSVSEICNLIDDNCDGEADEFVTTTYFADNDGDGFGFADNTVQSCEQPQDFVSNADDCDDSTITYEDLDGDGYGNANIVACGVLTLDDCDDNASSIYPGASEVCENLVDENCDGSDETCIYEGCTDVTACNFNAIANTDDGSCTYPAQSYLNCDGTCINDTDADGVCNEIEVAGCTDATACNYDSNATDENGSCTYPAQSYLNCNGTCINDTDADGVCNEIEVAGCTDATACNYDSNATDENGSCTYPAQSYLNCDGTCINDTDADGVCNEIEVAGCTDATACNYDSNATDENGSCTYPAQTYLNCNGTCINDTDADGVCNEIEVAGCTDATACNYDSNATDENGSCTYPAQSYLNCDGTCINDTDADGVCNEIEVAGCTDATACNYDSNATDDDGSCILPVAETCNSLDDDCDGEVDEFVTTTYYTDIDNDGFGDINNTIEACALPLGYVTNNTDCDDNNVTYLDFDGDGFGTTTQVACGVENNLDCNDGTALVQPNASEICNEVDDNCNGTIDEGVQNAYYADADGDGFGDVNALFMACTMPIGYVTNTTDCDDTQLTYLDVDQDGYGVGNPISCGANNNLDCNDINSSMNPGVVEICNGIDDNCSGTIDEGLLTTYYIDVDTDGFGDPNNMVDACTQPQGFVMNNEDCNDAASWANPNGVEVCNGVDDNCDGTIDEGVLLTYYGDADGDGFGNINDSLWSCAQPDGYIDNTLDCDDSQPTVFEGATEVYDGLDNNCNGLTDEGFEFIPDAFSPNQDGDYDYFVIDRLLPQEHVAIKVFNRWGGLVYESSDYQNDWNGFSNVGGHSGEEMSVGTYYYEIELQFSKKTYSGYITLWR